MTATDARMLIFLLLRKCGTERAHDSCPGPDGSL